MKKTPAPIHTTAADIQTAYLFLSNEAFDQSRTYQSVLEEIVNKQGSKAARQLFKDCAEARCQDRNNGVAPYPILADRVRCIQNARSLSTALEA